MIRRARQIRAHQLLSPLGQELVPFRQTGKLFAGYFRARSRLGGRPQGRVLPFEVLAPLLQSLQLIDKITLDGSEENSATLLLPNFKITIVYK